eukprot:scaffold1315_cov23-Cyclotella_meneghiniana.AAC.10
MDRALGVGVRLVRIGVGVGIGVGIVLKSTVSSSGGTLGPGGQWIEVWITSGSRLRSSCFVLSHDGFLSMVLAKGCLGRYRINCNAIVRLISELVLEIKASTDGRG